jgi:Ser/Thr protein kinase RdoA (MazF antagonist)
MFFRVGVFKLVPTRENADMQDDPTKHPSLKERIRQAYKKFNDRTKTETELWKALPRKTREHLGRVRFHQMVWSALNDPEQLELSIDGERLPIEDVAPEFLEHAAEVLRTQAAGFIRRAERLEAEAARRRQERNGKAQA